jgi:capsular polysaccharide transport system permease protein
LVSTVVFGEKICCYNFNFRQDLVESTSISQNQEAKKLSYNANKKDFASKKSINSDEDISIDSNSKQINFTMPTDNDLKTSNGSNPNDANVTFEETVKPLAGSEKTSQIVKNQTSKATEAENIDIKQNKKLDLPNKNDDSIDKKSVNITMIDNFQKEKLTESKNVKLNKIRGRRSLWPSLSFIVFFVIPLVIFGYYFIFIASDQFRVETQFSVRGSNPSPFAELGLSALPGTGTQNADSYIVSSYINSRQVLVDIQKKHNVDIRQFYSRPIIDTAYRINPTLSMEEFESYWRWMISVEFNSTTGNSSLIVYAFTDTDARKISELVLDVAQQLVNDLSLESRNRLISGAEQGVTASEDRLSKIQSKLTDLRNREQTVDPQQAASLEIAVVSELEKQLADLKTRQRALVGILSKESPSSRVIARQILALEAQIDEQRSRIGTGKKVGTLGDSTDNLSDVVSEYSQLFIDLEFATASYKAALTALESANVEAQKQQRYFATFVFPYTPDATIYPKRFLSTLLAAVALFLFWLISYFLVRSVYDHSI